MARNSFAASPTPGCLLGATGEFEVAGKGQRLSAKVHLDLGIALELLPFLTFRGIGGGSS